MSEGADLQALWDEWDRTVSYGEVRQCARTIFQTMKFESAALEVKFLMSAAANCDASDLIVRAHDRVDGAAKSKLRSMITRRLTDEPLAYIIGHGIFYGLRFDLNVDTLIPRPETEELVEQVLKMTPNGSRGRLLDIGTGSGAILVSILKNRPLMEGVGVDLSASALGMARNNAKLNQVDQRAEFLVSDYFSAVTGRFNMIVSNPPYIDKAAMEKLDKTIKNYEPHLALFGGEDGLNAYRLIALRAKNHLSKSGNLIFEIGYDQQKAVEMILEENGFLHIRTMKDYSGHARIVMARH